MIDVALVDDHRLFRDGLGRLLSTDARFRVVGEAASGEELLALLDGRFDKLSDLSKSMAHQPQAPDPVEGLPLVFMDIDMPGMGGIEATRRALELYPELRIVALSMHGDEEFRSAMLAAGAVGFLMKDSTLEQVVAAAFAALGLPPDSKVEFGDGEPLSARERGGDGRSKLAASSSRFQQPSDELSVREKEVLPLICAGLSTTQIAKRLFISPRTVDKHRASILDKTDSPNTAALVVWAVRQGLIVV